MPFGIGLTVGFVDGRWQVRLNPRYYPDVGRPDVLPPRRALSLAEPQTIPTDDPTPRRAPKRPPFGRFPAGPAANDPIYNIWRKRLAKLLGRAGGPAVASAEFLAIVLDTFGQNRLDEAYDEFERRRSATREARARRETEVQTIGTETPTPRAEPPEFPIFDRPGTPGLPGRVDLPGMDPGVIVVPPGAPSLPDFGGLPIPAPAPLPSPARIPSTGPGYWAGSPLNPQTPGWQWNPMLQPRSPVRPKPQSQPAQSPKRQPIGDIGLTGSNVGLVQSPMYAAQPLPSLNYNPQRCPQRRCKPKRRKLRRKCFKGMFKEGRWDDKETRTNWVEINCKTGREISGLGKHFGV